MAYTTIDDPSAHFQVTLYTGNGSANLAITNGGNSDLQPDLVWIKNRTTGTTDSHCLFDSTRGATKLISSDATTAETTDTDTLDSFASDGFQVDADVKVNTNTEKYVAWQWKADGGTRTTFTESGDNPGGGYQVNTTAGFSIVDYTGTGANGTIAHGLGAVPHCMIVKCRDAGRYWAVYNIGLNFPTDDLVYLDANSAANQHDPTWNNTAPTSSVFTVGTYDSTNQDAEKFIAYLWAPIQGYSKFGSYTGNNNASGPFVYTGFKPAFLMFKRTSGTENWGIVNIKSSPRAAGTKTNDMAYELEADTTGAEANQIDFWFLSNGFKIDGSGNFANGDGEKYVYMAFAEQPFVTSGGVPCTAR